MGAVQSPTQQNIIANLEGLIGSKDQEIGVLTNKANELDKMLNELANQNKLLIETLQKRQEELQTVLSQISSSEQLIASNVSIIPQVTFPC